jgi:hypothetical protein
MPRGNPRAADYPLIPSRRYVLRQRRKAAFARRSKFD